MGVDIFICKINVFKIVTKISFLVNFENRQRPIPAFSVSIFYNIHTIHSSVNYLGKFRTQNLFFLKTPFIFIIFVVPFYYLQLLTLNKNKSLLLMCTVGLVVRCLTDCLWARVRSFSVTIFNFLRKSLTQTWLNLVKAKSNDAVGQKCDILVKNRFRRAKNVEVSQIPDFSSEIRIQNFLNLFFKVEI